MEVRRAIQADASVLFDIWLRSVRETHGFVQEDDIQAMIPLVRDYLASSAPEFWIVCNESGTIMGFVGMAGKKMESLFLAPEFQGQGGGRRLVQHAQALHGELTVDVNEQNAAARGFYAACGFVVEGRSELDDQGRPYPLLHMRLTASVRPEAELWRSTPGNDMADISATTCVLAVNDLEVSTRYYCDVLGFTEDLAVEGWSFLSRGSCRLRLGHCPDATPIAECQDHSWFAYLHVDNAAALYAEFRSRGVELWHPLEEKPWAMREFAIVTVDGHRIVFGESIAQPSPSA